MAFTGSDGKQLPDGQGGTYLAWICGLDCFEATCTFKLFAGDDIRTLDILHHLADGSFVEHCICIISRPT